MAGVLIHKFQEFFLVYAAYLLATASPGPSNMAIMAVAMNHGRLQALAFAGGVVSGSMLWAVLAAMGISTVLLSYAHALFAIKIAGGLYLLYLAWKSARSALRPAPWGVAATDVERPALVSFYRRGLMLHLTNPKAVLAWLAIMSLGLKADTPVATKIAIILDCATLGILVFGGYAILFSTRAMVHLYQRAKNWIEAAFALFFAFAGFRLLLSRS